MEKLKTNLLSFFDGYFYPLFVALVVFIGHTFSIEIISVSLLIATAILAIILCDDLRVIISPFFMILFTFSYGTFKSGWLGSSSFAIFAFILLFLLFVALCFHFVLHKKTNAFKDAIKSPLFLGIAILCVSFLLNGFFNFSNYRSINITFAILLSISLVGIYVIFSAGIKKRTDTIEYLVYILYIVSILLMLQMVVLLLRDASYFPDGSIDKNTLILGWGMWNNIGGMLTMLLPIHFYLSATKKHGFIFYFTAILTYITILFSLSRSSLLFATLISAICILIICIKGKNIKTNRMITLAFLIIGLLGIIVLWNKLSTLLSSYINQGFGDNGRFEMYKHGFNNFLSHPIFGGGFGSCIEDNFGHGIEPNRYHNTFIELLATCGILGFGTYLFHRYQTVKLFLSKRNNLECVFLFISILALLLTSLLDNHFFNLYPTMYYAVILCVIEKSEN